MELNKVYLGDCLEIMDSIPDKSIDLVVTSPPYNKNGFRGRKDASKGKGRWQNSNINYESYEDDLPEDEYKKWQIELLDESHRVIKDEGSIFYNHKERRANGFVSHPLEWVLKSKAKYWQEIIWNRLSGVDHNINYLSPINELIFWLIKKTPKVYKKGGQTNIWEITPKPYEEHPAPFPLDLAIKAILLTTKEGDIVLDPFLGSGTTAIACIKTNRNFIGIEKEPKYVEIAERRIKNELDQLRLAI